MTWTLLISPTLFPSLPTAKASSQMKLLVVPPKCLLSSFLGQLNCLFPLPVILLLPCLGQLQPSKLDLDISFPVTYTGVPAGCSWRLSVCLHSSPCTLLSDNLLTHLSLPQASEFQDGRNHGWLRGLTQVPGPDLIFKYYFVFSWF